MKESVSCMVKRFRKPDTVEAYNAAGFRERYAMENGNKSTVYLNDINVTSLTYSKDVDYQDANGALYDTCREKMEGFNMLKDIKDAKWN